ncbi:hypothetical protein HY468_05025 [Candidatus Roizmanbacteria bacterium]|nr:hypothetical protein [Candidatus Roizmanbacteria bacterium]
MSKTKIAILGSAVDESEEAFTKARALATVLASHEKEITLLSGAFEGMPYEIVKTARKQSAIELIGFSSQLGREKLTHASPRADLSMYSSINYISPSFQLKDNSMASKKHRNVILTASCDAGILIAGRWGTLNEFTCLIDMGKVIGIYAGTGGMADELPRLIPKVNKPTKATIIIEGNPQMLVEKILTTFQK